MSAKNDDVTKLRKDLGKMQDDLRKARNALIPVGEEHFYLVATDPAVVTWEHLGLPSYTDLIELTFLTKHDVWHMVEVHEGRSTAGRLLARIMGTYRYTAADHRGLSTLQMYNPSHAFYIYSKNGAYDEVEIHVHHYFVTG